MKKPNGKTNSNNGGEYLKKDPIGEWSSNSLHAFYVKISFVNISIV